MIPLECLLVTLILVLLLPNQFLTVMFFLETHSFSLYFYLYYNPYCTIGSYIFIQSVHNMTYQNRAIMITEERNLNTDIQYNILQKFCGKLKIHFLCVLLVKNKIKFQILLIKKNLKRNSRKINIPLLNLGP